MLSSRGLDVQAQSARELELHDQGVQFGDGVELHIFLFTFKR